MSVSFSNNSLKVIDDHTLAYTVQKGSTLCSLAKEIAEETGRPYMSCYADLLKQNDFHDAKLNPAGKRDPNLIYAKDAKHEADVLKFTVDTTAKEKLSSFCMGVTAPAEATAAMRDAEAGRSTSKSGARFGDRPVVWGVSVPVSSEGSYEYDSDGDGKLDSSREDEGFAEIFYTEGEYGVLEFDSEGEALDSLYCEDNTADNQDGGEGALTNGEERLDSGLAPVDTGSVSSSADGVHDAYSAWAAAIYSPIPKE